MEQNSNILLANLEKLHTTEQGQDRIKRNLSFPVDDVVSWCKEKIKDKDSLISRIGKNWYIEIENCKITVNANSYTIITVHPLKMKKNREKIVENQYLDQLIEIFDGNHQEYLDDRNATQRDMLAVVYVKDVVPLGYAVVYQGKDFLEKEKYPIILQNLKEDSIYIWQLVTRKGNEDKGIGTSLVKYITEKYHRQDIYVVVDINNSASMKCQCKCGFIPIKCFEKVHDGKKKIYLLLKK